MSFQYSLWLALPLASRHRIASAFGIIKKGSTEVFNNTIKSDGFVLKDVESAMTAESIAKFFNTTINDYQKLWGYVTEFGEGRAPKIESNPVEASQSPVSVPNVVLTDDSKPLAPKKRGRPSKKIHG